MRFVSDGRAIGDQHPVSSIQYPVTSEERATSDLLPCTGDGEQSSGRGPLVIGHSLKVPHMGWNSLRLLDRAGGEGGTHPMFAGIRRDAYFYYVHSYYAQPDDPSNVTGITCYGVQFCGALASGKLWATQFHPEKSGANGLRLLGNFVAASTAPGSEQVTPWS